VQLVLGSEVVLRGTQRFIPGRLRAGGHEFTRRDFVVTHDGQKVLVTQTNSATPPLDVIQNWALGPLLASARPTR
jgi:hypothetical protein